MEHKVVKINNKRVFCGTSTAVVLWSNKKIALHFARFIRMVAARRCALAGGDTIVTTAAVKFIFRVRVSKMIFHCHIKHACEINTKHERDCFAKDSHVDSFIDSSGILPG